MAMIKLRGIFLIRCTLSYELCDNYAASSALSLFSLSLSRKDDCMDRNQRGAARISAKVFERARDVWASDGHHVNAENLAGTRDDT